MSYQQEKFKEIADKIRELTDTTDPIIPSNFAAKIDDVWETGLAEGETNGRQAQKTEFWEQFQSTQIESGSQDYKQAFCNKRFNDSTYDPPLPIIASGIYQGFFQSSLTSTKVPIIANCNMGGCFRWCNRLETIVELNVGESTDYGADAFFRCDVLANILMTGTNVKSVSFSDSPLLTSASVDSIIDCLKTLQEGEAAKTLTLHATVKGNLTDSQKAIIQEKGWTLA